MGNLRSNVRFEHIGYHIDYYVSGQFIGSCRFEGEPDRIGGYEGRRVETLEEDVITLNGRLIKKGTEATTELIPLCGKLIKK